MFDFLETASTILKTYWYIAIPSTILFLLMFLSSLLGFDSDSDIDSDIDVDSEDGSGSESFNPFDLFSFKNLISFLTFFSWAGISISDIGLSWLSLPIAFIIGLVITMSLNFLFFMFLKLQQDNTTNINNAVGKEGEVYLTISKNGIGKVEISLNGANRIYTARGGAGTKIQTGEKVIVIDVENNKILVVVKNI